MAASMAANSPPRPIRRGADQRAMPVTVSSKISGLVEQPPVLLGLPVLVVGRDLVGHPLLEQLALQGEHLLLLVRLGVVVPEQVQHTVHRQQREFVAERMSRRLSLFGRELRAQHDVAEHRRPGFGCVGTPARLQLVHREAHHVGGPGRSIHRMCRSAMAAVSSNTIDSSAAGFTSIFSMTNRATLISSVFGDVDARLVGYLDAHRRTVAGRARPAAGTVHRRGSSDLA